MKLTEGAATAVAAFYPTLTPALVREVLGRRLRRRTAVRSGRSCSRVQRSHGKSLCTTRYARRRVIRITHYDRCAPQSRLLFVTMLSAWSNCSHFDTRRDAPQKGNRWTARTL